ncbi:MAG: DUF971 domain-containing protein [Leptolyngbya sp. SIO1D8]|nr:DUF971 domain-containing protein [Leptolyngbya sp. SIO1D8]
MSQTASDLNKKKTSDHNSKDNERWLTINGKRFHYIWLRDNCICPACRHPTSFQKINDISTFSSIPKPLSVVIEEDQVIITWQEEPIHQSIFPIAWLMDYAYDQDAGTNNLHQKLELHKKQEILWDRAWIETNLPRKYDINTDDFDAWTEQILTLGFAILKINNHQDLENLISKIGPRDPFEGERVLFPVKSVPGATDLSETGYALDPHGDYETYKFGPHLLQFLYCVENRATGGESFLIDAFKVAKDFRQNHPSYFNLLVKTPIQFQQIYTDWQYYYRRSRQIIELDRKEQVRAIYFGHSHAYNWDLSFEQMEEYYEAYCAFSCALKDPSYHYCFRLEPGECIAVQNFRVLHGRNAFDANSGVRQLDVSYTRWDYFIARENFKLFQTLYLND